MGFIKQPVNLKKARKILSYVEKQGFKPIYRDFREAFIYVDREKDLKVYVYYVGEGSFIILPIERFYIPFIDSINMFRDYPFVLVDEGAARALLRGADLMAPGIKRYTEFNVGSLVVIGYDSLFIAIGEAIEPSNRLPEMGKGKVIKVLHYKGDKIWREVKKLPI